MIIQISPTKKIEDALVVWHEPNKQVDLCVDLRKDLHFKPNSLSVIYAFGILGNTKPKDVPHAIKNLYNTLKPGGQLYITENDFEYLNRAIIGGDLSIKEFNFDFLRESYFDQHLLIEMLEKAGFPKKEQRIWYNEGIKFTKEHFELIISGVKPKI